MVPRRSMTGEKMELEGYSRRSWFFIKTMRPRYYPKGDKFACYHEIDLRLVGNSALLPG